MLPVFTWHNDSIYPREASALPLNDTAQPAQSSRMQMHWLCELRYFQLIKHEIYGP